MDCESLEELRLPQGLVRIGAGAFKNCISLKKVFIPHGTRFIGKYAFSNNLSLEYIYLPDTIEHIGRFVFLGCPNIKGIYCSNRMVRRIFLGSFDYDIELRFEEIRQKTPPKMALENFFWERKNHFSKSSTIRESILTLFLCVSRNMRTEKLPDIPDDVWCHSLSMIEC